LHCKPLLLLALRWSNAAAGPASCCCCCWWSHFIHVCQKLPFIVIFFIHGNTEAPCEF
jgi:hypothetical protein